MARTDYPDLKNSPEIRDRLQRMGSLNVTKMMSHAPGAMVAYSKLGTELLLRGKLDPVLREAVILRVGQLCNSEYEWHQHESVARAVGMEEPILAAIETKDFSRLPDEMQTAITFAENIHENDEASAEVFNRARESFSEEELVELCLVIGYYRLTAGFLKSFDIETETTPPLGASMKK